MSYDEDDYDEECLDDENNSCDYGVAEFCEDPQCRANGLCTTECTAYMKAVKTDDTKQEEEK